jgi:hypothetical protein
LGYFVKVVKLKTGYHKILPANNGEFLLPLIVAKLGLIAVNGRPFNIKVEFLNIFKITLAMNRNR